MPGTQHPQHHQQQDAAGGPEQSFGDRLNTALFAARAGEAAAQQSLLVSAKVGGRRENPECLARMNPPANYFANPHRKGCGRFDVFLCTRLNNFSHT